MFHVILPAPVSVNLYQVLLNNCEPLSVWIDRHRQQNTRKYCKNQTVVFVTFPKPRCLRDYLPGFPYSSCKKRSLHIVSARLFAASRRDATCSIATRTRTSRWLCYSCRLPSRCHHRIYPFCEPHLRHPLRPPAALPFLSTVRPHAVNIVSDTRQVGLIASTDQETKGHRVTAYVG